MTSYSDENLDDIDAISGWGADDFDEEELMGRGRRRATFFGANTKLKPKKTLVNSNSTSRLPTLRNPLAKSEPPAEVAEVVPPTKLPLDKSRKNQHPRVDRVRQRKEGHNDKKPPMHSNPQPSPRTCSISDENAAIAAIGRQRRMKVVAAALANNISRKSGLVSVVSASFNGDSDDEYETEEPEEVKWPSSAPENPWSPQQEHLPRVAQRSTAPAGTVEALKKIHPPLPLPLLSIKPTCNGNETRLLRNNRPAPQAPRHWRRLRHQPTSLLATRDASENWETNFPPAPSAQKLQQPSLPDARSSAASTFKRAIPELFAPAPAPAPACTTAARAKELLPSIHQQQASKSVDYTTLPNATDQQPKTRDFKHINNEAKMRDGESVDDDDESWTHSYNDPDLLAKSMAGLIQALSTFADSGKSSKPSKVGKSRKQRAKLQQHYHLEQEQIFKPPTLRLPRPRESINVTSSRAPITKELEPSARQRKHRKLRSKKSIANTTDKKEEAPMLD